MPREGLSHPCEDPTCMGTAGLLTPGPAGPRGSAPPVLLSHPLAAAPYLRGAEPSQGPLFLLPAMPRGTGQGREGGWALSQQQKSKQELEAGSNKPQVRAVPTKLAPAEVGGGPWGLAAPFTVEKQSRARETNPNKFTTCLMPVQLLYMKKITACSMFVFHHMTPGIQRCCHTALGGPCAQASAHRSHTLTQHLSSALFPLEQQVTVTISP